MKQLVDALYELTPLVIQCCLAEAPQVYEKGLSKEAVVQLCGCIDGRYLTVEFLTSDTLPYIVALWNKTANVSDEIMSALLDGDAKASTDTKTELTLNESGTEKHVRVPVNTQR